MADDADSETTPEVFVDAVERITFRNSCNLDLASSIQECGTSLKLFFTNHFSEACRMMESYAHCSMYHSLSYGTILYIQAAMTLDMTDIEQAIAAMKQSMIVSNKLRKRTSLLGSVSRMATGVNYNEFTEVELHAELAYAESLLIFAMLTFIQDENLISFVKGGLRIRECYKAYKECNKILQRRDWASDKFRHDFESGVRLGVGTFNLMISLLPGRIMKLLEIVGFSGNKKQGLSELLTGSEMCNGLRSPLCSIVLLGYHTVISYVLGTADGDLSLASSLLDRCLQAYPEGAMFSFFAGRIEEIKGNLNEAVILFEDSISSQSEWKQFHHICYWELMWCYCFQSDWLMAMKYAEKLSLASRWSKATYTYQKACFLLMCEEQSAEIKNHVRHLFMQLPELKQRIAGKSLPFEKFAVAKAKRYLDQNEYLTLAAIELVYIWNGFHIVGRNKRFLETFLMVVESTLTDISAHKSQHQYYYDNYCLAMLLKGVCLYHRTQYLQAEQCFLDVVDHEKAFVHDHYLVPYALTELASLCVVQHRTDDAGTFLRRARKNYKGYSMESRLHFHIHALRLQMKEEKRLCTNDFLPSISSTPTSEVTMLTGCDNKCL